MATYPVGATRTYTTIQSAIVAAGAANDVDALVPVDHGTYTEALNIKTRAGSWAMPVTVYGADPANRPVIVCPATAHAVTADQVCNADAGTRVPSFTDLIWSGGSATTDIVYAANGGPMTFRRCDFVNLNKPAIRLASGGTGPGYMWIIDRCRFDACGQAVMSTDGTSYGFVMNCYLRITNTANMISCMNGASPNTHWQALNNSVASYLNGYVLFQIGTAKNNAIKVVSGTPSRLYDCTGGTYSNNCASAAASSANTGTDGGGNLTLTDPLFANAATGDFTITTASPCYNAGAVAVVVTTDFVGTARPQGLSYDIGALEVIATTTVSSITVMSSTSIRLNLAASVGSDATWATSSRFTVTSGTGAAVTVSSAAASGNPGSSITLTTSEHTNGATYTVAWSGLTNVTSSSTTYTGQGVAPTISSAAFTAAQTMRVTFSENMTNDAALIAASSYTLTPTAGVGFHPTAVTRISSTIVDITVDRGLGAYTGTLAVSGPVDLGGNAPSPSSVAIDAFGSSAAGATGRLERGASFVRLVLNGPVFRDAATWVAANVTIAPYLRAQYYGVDGSPATYVDFVVSDASADVGYSIEIGNMVGIGGDMLYFTGGNPPTNAGVDAGEDPAISYFTGPNGEAL